MFDMDAVYREYAVMVYKFLLSLCYEEELAEELTQETFYQAVRSVDRYDGSCKVSTWLCQIAKHLWYREIERRKDELKKDVKPLKKLKRVTRQMIAGTVLFCIVVIGIALGAYETYYGEVVQPNSEDVKITCEKIDPVVRIGLEP
ncbi:MAG: sigma-70 family RNA polymerase sigma factor [Lachnospiraceae bacterium]|nr:sigma-70 family RNA polymerase sigma factor [Lachnospiraceae bacterium]